MNARAILWTILLCGATSGSAHHSFAMFDQARRASVEGIVRTVEWTNPHVWIWIDVDEGGAPVTYGFESSAPSELTRFFGWSRTSLEKGDRVTVQYAPLRSGKNGGALRTIMLADGRELRTPRSDPPPLAEPRGAAARRAAMTPVAFARVMRTIGFVVVVVAATADAQSRSGPQGDSYESIAKLPDWSGVWVIPWAAFSQENVRSRQPNDPMAPPLAAAAATTAEALRTQVRTGKPAPGAELIRQNSELCLPVGMPNVMKYAFGIEFLFTPGRVTILMEQDGATRRVYTDGRSHDPQVEPSYLGESIGWWENGTLVIDTASVSANAELLAGVRSSGRAHVVERARLDERGNLRIDTVVDDPGALAKPWHITRTYQRSDVGIFERECLENNRDSGEGDPDLTPPR